VIPPISGSAIHGRPLQPRTRSRTEALWSSTSIGGVRLQRGGRVAEDWSRDERGRRRHLAGRSVAELVLGCYRPCSSSWASSATPPRVLAAEVRIRRPKLNRSRPGATPGCLPLAPVEPPAFTTCVAIDKGTTRGGRKPRGINVWSM
jgi:hypothetical protein